MITKFFALRKKVRLNIPILPLQTILCTSKSLRSICKPYVRGKLHPFFPTSNYQDPSSIHLIKIFCVQFIIINDWYDKNTALNKKIVVNKKILQNSTFAVATVTLLYWFPTLPWPNIKDGNICATTFDDDEMGFIEATTERY